MGIRYRTVLFDFDGTIIDSGPGILRCVREVITRLGYDMPQEEVLRKFVGPPLIQIFRDTFGLTQQEAGDVVELYRELYSSTNAIMEADVYPGVIDLLKNLNRAGVKVGIASIKREVSVKQTLKTFDMLRYFDAAAGASAGGGHADKMLIMQECIKRLGADAGETVMIGDSLYDAEAAENLGIDFCAALWGYGFDDPDDVEKHKHVFAAKNIAALERFLFNGKSECCAEQMS